MTQHEIQRLLPRHFQILDLCLAGNGPKEIAQALGMTPQAISLITHAPIFQHELSRRRDGITKETDAQLAGGPARAKNLLDEASVKAAGVQIGLLDHYDASIQLKASQSVLDRVFGSGKENKTNVVVLEPGAIQLLAIALQESDQDRVVIVQEPQLEKESV